MFLVVGLGNPGKEYAATRHNIGFMVAEELARRTGVGAWREKFGARLAQSDKALFIEPQEYMNLSGNATQRVASFYKVDVKDMIVLHDEIDLPFGTVRVKVGGGHGGHNGLRSIIEQLGPAFVRVRCGVGKPANKDRTVGHVLGGFTKEEQQELPFLIGGSADAAAMVMDKGPVAAMNQFNQSHESQRKGAS